MRFQVGEMAKLVIVRNSRLGFPCPRECIVLFRGPVKKGEIFVMDGEKRVSNEDFDYMIDSPSYVSPCTGQIVNRVCVMDWQLQKLDPPVEPESITRREEVEV